MFPIEAQTEQSRIINRPFHVHAIITNICARKVHDLIDTTVFSLLFEADFIRILISNKRLYRVDSGFFSEIKGPQVTERDSWEHNDGIKDSFCWLSYTVGQELE